MSSFASPLTFEEIILDALQVSTFKVAAATTELFLYQNNYVPGPGSLLSDFTEADFTGYASVVLTVWNGVVLDSITARFKLTPSPVSFFTQSGTAITNTIYGWYMTDGTNLIAAERFDTPIEMDTTGKVIQLYPEVYADGLSGPSALLN